MLKKMAWVCREKIYQPTRSPLRFTYTGRGGTLWVWKFFHLAHPLKILKEDKGDIQDYVLDLGFWCEKWKFPLCEPEQRGDPMDLGNFYPHHPLKFFKEDKRDFQDFVLD